MRMRSHRAMAVCLLASALVLGAATSSDAQVNPRDLPIVAQPQQRFNSGQDVQPVFEGWTREDDGGYLFHFGYMNRNYVEQPSIPVGENNFFSPGPEDRGQPAYFYPRTQRYRFRVPVPADFALDDELVWTVTHHGSTQVAVGWLQPEWEIDENTITSNTRMQFGRSVEELFANQPASLTVESSASSVAVGEPLTVTAMLTDDEYPTEQPRRDRSQRRRLPTLIPPEDAPEIPDNITWYSRPSPPRNGLAVLWVVFRGPADVAIEPSGFQGAVTEEEEGDPQGRIPTGPPPSESTNLEGDGWTSAKFETTVTFDEPGTYTLRAYGSDSMFLTMADVAVTVR